jgi:hypothetical protein
MTGDKFKTERSMVVCERRWRMGILSSYFYLRQFVSIRGCLQGVSIRG